MKPVIATAAILCLFGVSAAMADDHDSSRWRAGHSDSRDDGHDRREDRGRSVVEHLANDRGRARLRDYDNGRDRHEDSRRDDRGGRWDRDRDDRTFRDRDYRGYRHDDDHRYRAPDRNWDHYDHYDRDRYDHDRFDRGWHRERYYIGEYRRPWDYREYSWHRGDRLPRAWYAPPYVIGNYGFYRLYAPPRGCHWVRVDHDVVLAAIATGIVLDVMYDYFW